VELALDVKRAMIEKAKNSGMHIKPHFIRGHLDGMPIEHMLIDGGASIKNLPLSLFKKLSHIEGVNIQILALVVLQVIRRRQKK
jgi:hypothetical protein